MPSTSENAQGAEWAAAADVQGMRAWTQGWLARGKIFLPGAGWIAGAVVCACSSFGVLSAVGLRPPADLGGLLIVAFASGLAGYGCSRWRGRVACAEPASPSEEEREASSQSGSMQEHEVERWRQLAGESDEGFRLLADSLRQMVWTTRRDGAPDFFNLHWFRYTGLTRGQTMDWGWREVLHPDDLQRFFSCWVFAFTAGCPYTGEFRFKRASDGRHCWHEVRVFPQRGAAKIVRWIGLCTEIQELRESGRERVSQDEIVKFDSSRWETGGLG